MGLAASLVAAPGLALTVKADDSTAPSVRIVPLDPLPTPESGAPEGAAPEGSSSEEPSPERSEPGGANPKEPPTPAEGTGDTAPDEALLPDEAPPPDSEKPDRETPDRAASGEAAPEADTDGTDAVRRTDLAALPEPVSRMRRLILEAARAGNLEAVARLVGVGDTATQLTLVPEGEDAITLLRGQSGDEDGFEILAILAEILEAPYTVVDEGTDEALYLWPWLAGASLDALTPAERVEAYRLMTAGDFDQSREFGTYVFFRTGISSDGRWEFFLAGD